MCRYGRLVGDRNIILFNPRQKIYVLYRHGYIYIQMEAKSKWKSHTSADSESEL